MIELQPFFHQKDNFRVQTTFATDATRNKPYKKLLHIRPFLGSMFTKKQSWQHCKAFLQIRSSNKISKKASIVPSQDQLTIATFTIALLEDNEEESSVDDDAGAKFNESI